MTGKDLFTPSEAPGEAEIERLLSMPLTAFARGHYAVLVYSDKIKGHVWFVSSPKMFEEIIVETPEIPIFTPRELDYLCSLDNVWAADLRRFCELKKVFPRAKITGGNSGKY